MCGTSAEHSTTTTKAFQNQHNQHQPFTAFHLPPFSCSPSGPSSSSSSCSSSAAAMAAAAAAAAGPFLVHRLGLVIDGRTLAYALDQSLEDKFLAVARSCRSVLCCRSTPLQKSMVVKLVRNKLKVMTLAIGKGTLLIDCGGS